MDRRAPDLARETPEHIDDAARKALEAALRARHGPLVVAARDGKAAFVIVAVLGTERRAHEIFVFARGDTAQNRALDYLDGVLGELLKKGGPDSGHYLPLDWEGRPYDDDIVFVRGEIRDYVAEEQAAELLGETPPTRALGS